MAEPIKNVTRMKISEEAIKEQNLKEVMEAVSENKESVLKGIDLLTTINDTGALEIVSALLKQRDVVVKNLVNELDKDRYTGSIENLLKLFILMGSINTEDIGELVDKMNQGLQDAQEISKEDKTTYFDLLKALKDPEINRSVTMLLQFLRIMGKE